MVLALIDEGSVISLVINSKSSARWWLSKGVYYPNIARKLLFTPTNIQQLFVGYCVGSNHSSWTSRERDFCRYQQLWHSHY